MVFWQTNGESMSVDYVEESIVNSEMDDLSLAVKSFAARVKWVNLAQEVMPSSLTCKIFVAIGLFTIQSGIKALIDIHSIPNC